MIHNDALPHAFVVSSFKCFFVRIKTSISIILKQNFKSILIVKCENRAKSVCKQLQNSRKHYKSIILLRWFAFKCIHFAFNILIQLARKCYSQFMIEMLLYWSSTCQAIFSKSYFSEIILPSTGCITLAVSGTRLFLLIRLQETVHQP